MIVGQWLSNELSRCFDFRRDRTKEVRQKGVVTGQWSIVRSVFEGKLMQ